MRKALVVASILLLAGVAIVAGQDATTNTTSESRTETNQQQQASSSEENSSTNNQQTSTSVEMPGSSVKNETSSSSSESNSKQEESSASNSSVQEAKNNTQATVVNNLDGTQTTIITTTVNTGGKKESSQSQSSSESSQKVDKETTMITTVTDATAAPVNIPVTTSQVQKADCDNGINLCFAIDKSGSLSDEKFAQEIDWARQMGKKLDADTGSKSRLGLVLFGTDAVNVTEVPDEYEKFDAALNGATWGGIKEATNLGGGVSACAEQLIALNQNRPSFIMTLTDGNPNIESPDGVLDPAAYSFIAAEGAKTAGIYMVSVAVTGIQGLNSTLLQLMASTNEAGPLYFPIDSTENLPQTIDKFVDFLCNYDGGSVEGQDTTLNAEQLQQINTIIQETITNSNKSSSSSESSSESNSFITQSTNQFINEAEETVQQEEDETVGTGRVCGTKPTCRMYVEDALCCKDTNELVTSRKSSHITIMCTDPIIAVDAGCIFADGPNNVTVSNVFNGAGVCGGSNYFRYHVNWEPSEYQVEMTTYEGVAWNGTVTIDALGGSKAGDDNGQCAFKLVAPCGYEGVAYHNITELEPMQMTVANDPEKTYGFINPSNKQVDLNLLDTMSWMDLEKPGQCKTMLNVWLPTDFYEQNVWHTYNEGLQYLCDGEDGDVSATQAGG